MNNSAEMLSEAKKADANIHSLIKVLDEGEEPDHELIKKLEIDLKTLFVLLNAYKRSHDN